MIKKLTILFLLFPSVCWAQLENFTGEFVGLEGTITYTDSAGEEVTEPCVNVIGRYSRSADSFRISESLAVSNAEIDDIPTACLAREHWWTSFELLMKAQREYAECVSAIKEHQRRLGMTCLIDDVSCGGEFARVVLLVKEYWVPHSIVINNLEGTSKAPRREDFLAHFEAGIFGLDVAISHRDACRAGLAWIRTQ